MSTTNFIPISLNDDSTLERTSLPLSSYIPQYFDPAWEYTSGQCQYNFLPSTLSSDIKIENLEEDVIPAPSECRRTKSRSTVKAESDSHTRKKRKRPEENEEGDVSFVKLTREQLLVMSSVELEERVKLLQHQRPLTSAENEEIKRQRKLIKNREYAQTSRMKKRETLSTLKAQVTEITAENEVLKSQVSHLSMRVQLLELENSQLRSYFTPTVNNPIQEFPNASVAVPIPTYNSAPESPGSSSPYSETITGSPSVSNDEYDQFLGTLTSDSDDTFTLDMMNGLDISLPLPIDQYSPFSKPVWGFPDGYTTGICLLVILFSFGLFFNGIPGIINTYNSGGHLPRSSTARTLSEKESGDEAEILLENTEIIPKIQSLEEANAIFLESEDSYDYNLTEDSEMKKILERPSIAV